MPRLLAIILTALCLFSALPASAESGDEKPSGDFAYYGFDPDIITNYLKQGKKLGYVRVTVEIMVEGNDNLKFIEHHAPLLRAALVETLGRQPEDKIKSLAGREEIRRTCLKTVRLLLKKEVGHELAADVMFTKYIYF